MNIYTILLIVNIFTLFVNINHGFETTDDVVLQKQKLIKAEKDRLKRNRVYTQIKYLLSKYFII